MRTSRPLRGRRGQMASVFVHIGEDARPVAQLVIDSPLYGGIGVLDMDRAELERLRGELTRAAAILRELEGS